MNDDKRLVILVCDADLVNAFEEMISPAPMQVAVELCMKAVINGFISISPEEAKKNDQT